MHHETVADLYKVLEGLEWLLQNTLLEAWKLLRSKDREAVVKVGQHLLQTAMMHVYTQQYTISYFTRQNDKLLQFCTVKL